MAYKIKKYYAVRKGRNTGIYQTWSECESQVKNFSGAEYKSFLTEDEARDYLNGRNGTCHTFNNDEIGALKAYVDGSFNLLTSKYGYGCVLLLNGEVICELSGAGEEPALVGMRNVAGEIMGSLNAMNYALKHGHKSIVIYYDYMGIEKWANGEWKTNAKGTKAYKQAVDRFRENLEIQFVKVPAHQGVTYNERADVLAKRGAEI